MYKVEDMDYYERTMRKINEAGLVNQGILDYEQGKVVDGKDAINKLRAKHGI